MTSDFRRYRLRHRTRPLDVWIAGEGTPLLLLHGWGLSGRAYRRAMHELADRGFRVAAPSLAVAEEWDITRAAEIAVEAMVGVDAAPGAVVGHSFGGAIGAQMAIDHTDFITSLVAVNSPLVPLGGMRLGRIMLPGAHYRIVMHRPAAAALFRSVSSRDGLGSLVRSARWFFGSGQAQMLAAVAASGVPRALVWAKRDTLLPLEVGMRAAEALGCELVIIEEGDGWPGTRPPDHDWPFREPVHFAETMAALIRKLTTPAKASDEAERNEA